MPLIAMREIREAPLVSIQLMMIFDAIMAIISFKIQTLREIAAEWTKMPFFFIRTFNFAIFGRFYFHSCDFKCAFVPM